MSEVKVKQNNNNNSDFMIDPKFRDNNRLFVLSFKNSDNNPAKTSFLIITVIVIYVNSANKNKRSNYKKPKFITESIIMCH